MAAISTSITIPDRIIFQRADASGDLVGQDIAFVVSFSFICSTSPFCPFFLFSFSFSIPFFALNCKWFCDNLEKRTEISTGLYGFTAVLQFHTKILCNLCESCMIFSQKGLTNQKKCSIINTFHRKSEKILDERNKMQYNRGRCNFCNTMFDDESRPTCGLIRIEK